ncbi:serine hydrolase [Paremcibacter congregatus]|nr:serine hydrolase [Paremcibacter congregatus]
MKHIYLQKVISGLFMVGCIMFTTIVQASSFKKDELEAYIRDSMEKWHVPGLSIAIVKNGETILSKGYGVRELGKNDVVDENTLFPIAGSTRSFTASALAILVAEDKIDWNDRMVDVLPGFRTGSDLVSNYATIIDALANRTGLETEVLSWFPHPDVSRAELLGRLRYVKPAHEFRSDKGVNLLMIVAAGEIIPAQTGISWDDFVRVRLFDPVGMKHSITGPHLFGGIVNIATPHAKAGGELVPVAHTRTSNIGPTMSIYSSASDMAKWLLFQLANGKVGGEAIIPEEEIKMMRSSHSPRNMKFPGVVNNFASEGLGLLISDSAKGHKIYSGGGDVDGMESFHAFIPELDLGIAVMANTHQVVPQRLTTWIIDRFTDAPMRDWVSEGLSAYERQFAQFFSALEKNRQDNTDLSKKTSLPMQEYAGLYQHPLLGNLKIEYNVNGLSFILGQEYKGALKHANHDTFYLDVKTPYIAKYLLKGPARFIINHKGKIASLFVENREFQKVDVITKVSAGEK